MQFTFEELKNLSQHVRDFRLSQESEGSKTTLTLLEAIEARIGIAISRSLASSKTTKLDLDSHRSLMIKRAVTKARLELVSKIQHASFLQSSSEVFDGAD